MKPDFDRAQNAATRLLLTQNIDSLYIDARNFTLPDGLIIDSMQNFCALGEVPIEKLNLSCINGALFFQCAPYQLILYDDSIENEQRKHWGIIHELGHVVMKHPSDACTYEVEAHFFAAQLVAPEIVLIEIAKRQGSLSAYDIFSNFNMSYAAAEKRTHTLEQRPCYNSEEIDKQLLQKFLPIIDRAMPRFTKGVS